MFVFWHTLFVGCVALYRLRKGHGERQLAARATMRVAPVVEELFLNSGGGGS